MILGIYKMKYCVVRFVVILITWPPFPRTSIPTLNLDTQDTTRGKKLCLSIGILNVLSKEWR